SIIVATVSCIYGIGSPDEWRKMSLALKVGQDTPRSSLIARLIAMQYERNDIALAPGKFRVQGETIDIIPGYSDEIVRLSLNDGTIERISILDPLNMNVIQRQSDILLFPAKHYLVPESAKERALREIELELEQRLPELDELCAHRLRTRTKYDIELIREMGYCNGIENYSRHFDGRSPGQPPYTLLDFLPKDAIIVIDESHVTIPQLHGMFRGDKTRKKNLVDYGFRLPSAYDNRPLKFEEFEEKVSNHNRPPRPLC
ncbi:MAG: excinuclease ABC subunit B, partial [Candidatus Anstonellales archaeon]